MKEGWFIMVSKPFRADYVFKKVLEQSETGYTTQRDAELELLRLHEKEKSIINPNYIYSVMHLYWVAE